MNERTLLDVVLEDVQAAEHEEGYTVISFEEQIEYEEIDELRRATMEISEPAPLTYSAS